MPEVNGNGRERIWARVEEIRSQYEELRAQKLPIDVFSFAELELGLDMIPFDDLSTKYRVEAAIRADFSGIYIDAEQYSLLESAPVWKLSRLRFTFAHELAHYFLHRDLPKPEHFKNLDLFREWSSRAGGKIYTIEQEANEFAGRLLVPKDRLAADFSEFDRGIRPSAPDYLRATDLRRQFADKASRKYGVNSQVIETRLDRENVWPTPP
jgi:IrrE N-terminal-like domain